MAKLTLQDSSKSDFPEKEPLPSGSIVLTEIKRCEMVESRWLKDESDPSKGNKMQVKFAFEVIDDRPEYAPFKGQWVWGYTPDTFSNHESCKLRLWVEEIHNMSVHDFPPGFELDLDDLVGKRVRVLVGNRTSRQADGTSKTYDFADALVRVRDQAPISRPKPDYSDEEPF